MNQDTQRVSVWLRGALLAAICLGCTSLAACGGLAGIATRSPTAQQVASPTATPTVPGVQVGDQQNGQTITLYPGEILQVALSSTFWSFQGSSDSHVLAQVGAAAASPAPFNQQTCPYGGCGSVTAVFRAVAPGTAHVSASRVSCGEAMRCVGSEGTYQLTVEVAEAS